jgi:hypothetical protein
MHRIGQGQKDRDRRQWPHAGKHADQIANQHSDEGPHEIVPFERDAKALPQIG